VPALKGRLPLLRLKDFANGRQNKPNATRRSGRGNLDWRRIITAAGGNSGLLLVCRGAGRVHACGPFRFP